MPVTMKQIAQDCGVSIVTVSKVLRNHLDIGPETRRRVLERTRQLGYRPNLVARSLVTGRSSLVGFIVPDLIHPFFAEIAHSLGHELRKHGIYLLLCTSEGDLDLEQHQVEHLLGRALDAIVIAPVASDAASLTAVTRAGTPLVVIDRDLEQPGTHFVGSDDLMAGRLATQHLIEIGCRRIAHIRGPHNAVGERRLMGYRRALQHAGIAFDPALVSAVSTGDMQSRHHGEQAITRLLALPQQPDGVFCFSDPIAIGALNVLHDRGIAVPRQLAIIGCGNLHYDIDLWVSLSSVDQASQRIGQRIAAIILDRILPGKDTPGETVKAIVKPHLVLRDSTRR